MIAAHSNNMILTVASYNVLADCTLHHFTDSSSSIYERANRQPRIASKLLATRADVLCLQEVDQISYDYFLQQLSSQDEYTGTLMLNGNGRFGCAIFVNTAKIKTYEFEEFPFHDGSNRTAVFVWIGQLLVISAHLDYNLNVTQMKQLVRTEAANCLICGDLNAAINSATLRIAKKAGFKTKQTAATVCTDGKTKTIDFILAKGDAEIQSLKTESVIDNRDDLQDGCSDHVMVLATIEVGSNRV